jgi:carboxyl-terminal processing protease
MNPRRRRATVLALLVIGGGCLLGGMAGSRADADGDRSATQLQTFARVLALVEDNYVGKVDDDAMIENSIQGMLRTLDPHSNYLDRDSYGEMKDEQRGKFSGLGIQITKRGPDKPLTIIAPIDGTPASRAGLLAGDVIFKIEGEETIHLTVQDAVRRLKGEKGSRVTITIQRPGEDNLFDVTLMRDEIPTYSIPLTLMLQPGVGLVRISNFTSTTSTELDESLRKLQQQGMTKLLLDLRSNPGGLLEQAVGVSERFIPAGKMVVYTRGRISGSDQDYPASKGVERTEIPLVVLIDHSSASASEIVSGAIQDHDRGILVGETTFGKGLVQRVIPLRNGGALALTTAKYYTPSGRLIQRDYTDLDDYFANDEEETVEPVTPPERGEIRRTDSGRVVYGGGGITPDHVVHAERATPLLSRMLRENLIFDFSVRYAAAHPELKPEFAADDKLVSEYRKFLAQRAFTYEAVDFEATRPALDVRIKAQIARVKWGSEAEARVLAAGDAQVQKALTLFDEASRLLEAGESARREKEKLAQALPNGSSL